MISGIVRNIGCGFVTTGMLVPLSIDANEVAVNCHDLSADAELVSCHWVSAKADAESITFDANAVSVQSFSLANYLKVDKDVVWVTPDEWAKLLIMSNTDWTIT